MPQEPVDLSLLQVGRALFINYSTTQIGSSSQDRRTIICGVSGVLSDTEHGRPGDNRAGIWARQYNPGPGSALKFFVLERLTVVGPVSSVAFRRISSLPLRGPTELKTKVRLRSGPASSRVSGRLWNLDRTGEVQDPTLRSAAGAN